jgi:hypothetical protein
VANIDYPLESTTLSRFRVTPSAARIRSEIFQHQKINSFSLMLVLRQLYEIPKRVQGLFQFLRNLIYTNIFQMIKIIPMHAKMIRQTMPNIRTCLLQSLQTSDGHHRNFKVTMKPKLPSKPTEPRSSSDFCFLQLAQVNMV